jgi:hypothetical protein
MRKLVHPATMPFIWTIFTMPILSDEKGWDESPNSVPNSSQFRVFGEALGLRSVSQIAV